MHPLRIYNSLGNKIEEFVPLIPGKVAMYCCGPTVYNDPHIGNFRPVIVFDTLRRLLTCLGYEVRYASNYTDVDDKIINRAKELGISEKELTDSVIEEYARLVKEVGALPPDETPRPTVYMGEMISYIEDLVDNGTAYAVDGDVYFRVRSVPNYGELSNNAIDDLESGSRIAVGEKKEDPLDFALWKKTSDGIKWSTKWGEGRPGWHTECCVMIHSIFKEYNGLIDIHGGGFDLKFPHHENEMAQAKAHDHCGLARYWMHNGFIDVNNVKMSKSLGNVILMKDVVSEYGGIPFRMMLLAAHYRAPASFSVDTIKEAGVKYRQLCDSNKRAAILLERAGVDVDALKPKEIDRFLDAICEDLNTPNALAVLYEYQKALNSSLMAKPLDLKLIKENFAKVRSAEWVLGINVPIPHLDEEGKRLYQEYDEAKAAKDYAKSDLIRGELIAKGIF